MRKLTLPLAAVFVVLSIMAAYFWTQLGVEREQLAALQARVAEMEKAGQAAASNAAPLASTLQSGANPTVPGTSQAAAPAVAKPAAGTSGAKLAEGLVAAMASNPDSIRRELEKQFPDAAKELDLSPDEEKKFFALLARQTSGAMSSAMGMLAGMSGDSAAQQESLRKMLEAQQAADKEMATLLGARRHRQWEEYQGTAQARQQVQQLRYLLGSGPNALTEDKAKPLIAALGQETARANRDMQAKLVADARTSRNLLEDQLKYSAESNQRLVSTASSFLNGTQLERYKQMLGQTEELMRAMMGSGAQGKSPGSNGARQ